MTQPRKRIVVVLAILLILAGGGVCLLKEMKLKRHTRTAATIVDFKTKRSNNSYSHYPVIEFVDRDGRHQRHESRIGSSRPLGEVGDEIAVYYDPENPSDVTINTLLRKHFIGGMIVFFGIGALLVTRIQTTASEPSVAR